MPEARKVVNLKVPLRNGRRGFGWGRVPGAKHRVPGADTSMFRSFSKWGEFSTEIANHHRCVAKHIWFEEAAPVGGLALNASSRSKKPVTDRRNSRLGAYLRRPLVL